MVYLQHILEAREQIGIAQPYCDPSWRQRSSTICGFPGYPQGKVLSFQGRYCKKTHFSFIAQMNGGKTADKRRPPDYSSVGG